MIIERLVVENWRGFKGTQKINFSTDTKKNINLIIAENGTGKSNLMEAIHWCLYGDMPAGASQPEKKINSDALKEKKHCRVELIVKMEVEKEGVSKDEIFQLSRIIFSNNEESKVTAFQLLKGDKSSPKPVSNFPLLVAKLMPKELSSFFLFSGEGVSKFFETNNEVFLETAIENVQGITYAKLALDDLDAEISKIDNKILALAASSDKARTALKNNESLENDVLKINSKIKQHETRVKEIDSRCEEINKLIEDSGHNLAKEYQEKQNTAERLIANLKTSITDFTSRRNKLLNDQLFDVAGYKIKEELEPYFDEMEAEGLIPAEISVPFVEKILDRQKCICGREIGENERTTINDLFEKAATVESEQRYLTAFSDTAALNEISKNFLDEHEEIHERLRDLNASLEEQQGIVDAAKKAKSEIDDQDIQSWESEHKSLSDERWKITVSELPSLLSSKKLAEDKIKENKKIIKQENNEVDNDYLKKQFEYLSSCRELLEQTINELKSNGRDGLLNYLNELAELYSRKGHRFKYRKDSYYPMMLSQDQLVEDPANQGDKVIKAIFYATSIIKFCIDRHRQKDEIIEPGVIAPMICDAVLSALDGPNAQSVSKVLAETPEQLIIFLNDESFHKGFEKVLEDNRERLGTLYYLERSTTQSSSIDEKITLFGNKYSPWLYKQKSTKTKIIELNKDGTRKN